MRLARLVPRTLFGQIALVLGGMVVASQITNVFLVDAFLTDARADKIAQLEVNRTRLITMACARFQASECTAFAAELQNIEGVLVLADRPKPAAARPLPQEGFIAVLAARVRDRLGPETEILLGSDELRRGLWIREPKSGLWVFLPNDPVRNGFPWGWVISISIGVLFVVVPALLLVWRINLPLRELAFGVNSVGRGRKANCIIPRGPQDLRELAQCFNRMVDALTRADHERKLVLAGISHDVRGPLTRVRLRLSLLTERSPNPHVMSISSELDTIETILDQFLTLVQEERELPLERGNVNELVALIADRYSAVSRPPVLRLDQLPLLEINATAIKRLLSNLVDNAYRHGGGVIEIETRHCGGTVCVNVRDRGHGIQNLDEASKRIVSGEISENERGLGLAIAYRMAQLHGGSIILQGRHGGGLDVEVRLPIKDTCVESQAA